MSKRLVAAAILLLLAGCSREKNPTPAGSGAAELTTQGWAAFELAEHDGAAELFAEAVAKDPEYAEAYVGAGWTDLARADASAAEAHFESAASAGEVTADLLAGRAAARLALGGEALDGAIADAGDLLVLAPDYVFVHRPSFGETDVRLVEAFALAASARYAEALVAADAIEPSAIAAGDPVTWQVGGEICDTFSQAVLARLQQLSEAEIAAQAEE